jgi:glycosyltransferase involved in cell wall biosynthesis
MLHGPEILLSVAIVTRNRPDSLERCLQAVRAQSIQPFEVIVSDDSAPEEAVRVRTLAREYGCSYWAGPRRGLYANRNFAAERCHGSHIRTMDDDHVLPPEHFVRCLEAVNSDPRAIWTTGEIGYLEGKLVGVSEVANQLDPSGFGRAVINRDDNWGIADGSTIYPREVFDRGFRMVEDFAFGPSYLEFGAYLYRRGWICRCVPEAMVEHHATGLSRPDPISHLFASICFNRYFRPDTFQLVRHVAPRWRRWKQLPKLFERAKERWKAP